MIFSAHYTPQVKPISLKPILTKPELTTYDYGLLYKQTGLTPIAIREMKELPHFEERLLRFQKNFLRPVRVKYLHFPAFNLEERISNKEGEIIDGFELAPYHNGDIFFTTCVHTLGWRHGHIGLVIDDKNGKTLEALRPGVPSAIEDVNKWRKYPTFKMLRPQNISPAILTQMVNYASYNLNKLPYHILAAKDQPLPPQNTYCSLLIWQIFLSIGINLNEQGGYFVTPQEIASSPYLQLVQIYGYAP